MKLLRTILSAGLLLAAPAVEAAKSRGEDPKEDALYDINTGMAGLQQATKDPKLLAQLMQDMNVSLVLVLVFPSRVAAAGMAAAPREW
jgi:hypothetical protein